MTITVRNDCEITSTKLHPGVIIKQTARKGKFLNVEKLLRILICA